MAFIQENLSQKTFVAESVEEIDNLCNKFKDENPVRFAQSSQIYDFGKKKIIYINTLFYLPAEENSPQKMEVPQETKVQPELWDSCKICNSRWKWSHFKWCPNKHGIEALPEEHHKEYMEIWNNENENKTT